MRCFNEYIVYSPNTAFTSLMNFKDIKFAKLSFLRLLLIDNIYL